MTSANIVRTVFSLIGVLAWGVAQYAICRVAAGWAGAPVPVQVFCVGEALVALSLVFGLAALWAPETLRLIGRARAFVLAYALAAFQFMALMPLFPSGLAPQAFLLALLVIGGLWAPAVVGVIAWNEGRAAIA